MAPVTGEGRSHQQRQGHKEDRAGGKAPSHQHDLLAGQGFGRVVFQFGEKFLLVVAHGVTVAGIKLVEGQTEAFRKPLFALAFLSIGMATDLRRLASPGMGRLLLVYLVAIFGFIIWMALAISWIFFHDIPAIPATVTP